MLYDVRQPSDMPYQACPTAIISPLAQIGDNVEIGPYSIIGDDVHIGNHTKIGAHVHIEKDTVIGEHNQIYYGAVIGNDPQDLKYQGERSHLIIGHHNIIREFVTISRGTQGGGYLTQIGDYNLMMSHAHVGHDVHMGNHNVLAQYAGVAGHAIISDYATLGGHTVIHQFAQIGAYSMVGACTFVTKDVLPYSLIQGNPAQYYGMNVIGLRRREFTTKERHKIQKGLKLIHQKGFKLVEIIEQLTLLNQEHSPHLETLIQFLQKSERGIY